ncbi:MAG: hypothetical protein ACI9YM_001629 [Brevundimonas sp.]|jgi:hypothetical protein|uniref:hypothetical protein n=1 Tax=Brevundimonas sp. TaxID=1871086 RepID=UPI002488EF95|nr:hypothetical protein [Brevundimonas sp.]MDI1282697.1 hypothetical protein [Brevundimonas sp.]
MTTLTDTPKPPLALRILGIVTLGGLGALTGYGVTQIALMRDQTWADSLATAMAVALLAIAALSIITLARRPSTVPRACGFLQIAVFLLAGAMLLLPMFGPAWANADVVFGGIVVLSVLQGVANLMLWRAADEMLRRIMAETAATAFWVLQTALFLYAAAERLGLVGTVSGWGLIGILMAVYLLASIVASARRGIH